MYPLVFRGLEYQSSEHAYQAQKPTDPKEKQLIINAESPGEAKRLGNKKNCVSIREDWDEVKIEIMTEIIHSKFLVSFLRMRLASTGDAILIEGNTWGDKFWGTVNGEGLNNLGIILMNERFMISGTSTS